jgi:hypothetical protein
VIPRAASASQAASTSARRVPKDRIATRPPSRIMRPLPISSGTPRSGISTPTPSPRGKRKAIGSVVMGRGRGDHVNKLCLVGGGHDGEPGQIRQKGHIVAAGMGGPSAPTSPARSIAKRTGRRWIATSCTT